MNKKIIALADVNKNQINYDEKAFIIHKSLLSRYLLAATGSRRYHFSFAVIVMSDMTKI